MTKNQKIWFAVFSAMFLIPEILWGLTINNFLYGFLYPSSLELSKFHLLPIVESNSFNLFVVFIQWIGLLLGLIYLFFISIKNKFLKSILIFIFTILLLLVFYVFLFAINFNPQIG